MILSPFGKYPVVQELRATVALGAIGINRKAVCRHKHVCNHKHAICLDNTI